MDKIYVIYTISLYISLRIKLVFECVEITHLLLLLYGNNDIVLLQLLNEASKFEEKQRDLRTSEV